MATLYRKYRPQNFKEVVGQNHIKLTLEHEIESGKLAHAYLFCGPRAVGKTTLARVLAKAVNCLDRKEGEHEPCDKCLNCEEIKAGRSLDTIEIDAASHTGVDNVRENIIAQARVAPSRLKYKVFIIDEAHMLSISAFNALLKVLEEPPEYVIFILCTTETHKVPTTIISRCQRFDFRRISVSDVVKKLSYIAKTEKINIDKSILEAVARQSEGHMRDAESLLGQIISVGGKEITREEADLVIPRSDLGEIISLIGLLAKKDASSALGLVNNLIDQGVDLKTFVNDLIEILRKIMFAKINPALAERLGMELGESLEIKMNEASRDLTLSRTVLFIEQFIKAGSELKASFVIQLPVELAVIRLCSAATSQPPSAVNSLGTNIGNNPAPAARTGFTANQKHAVGADAQADQPAAPLTNLSGKTISKDDVLAKWNEVLIKVKKYNHSLSFILRACEPRQIDNTKLCLAFKYKFHKDRVDDTNIRAIIEKVLVEVYSAPLTIEAVVDENLEVGNNERPLEQPPIEQPPLDKGGRGDLKGDLGDVKEDDKNNNSGVPAGSAPEGGQGSMINSLLDTFGGKVVG